MTAHPETNILPVATTNISHGPITREQRDAEICRQWQAKWTGPKIAEALGVKPHTIANVIRKNGLVRRVRDAAAESGETVSAADAPVEAWQQAMLPEVEKAGDELGMAGTLRRALVILSLLRLKPYPSLAAFETWATQVTGYEQAEVTEFLRRAQAGLIINAEGQPDPAAFKVIEGGAPPEIEVAAVLLAGVLDGTFLRTSDDKFYAAEEAEQPVDTADASDATRE